MSGTLGKMKGKNLSIKNKDLKWFRVILEKILNGDLPLDNIRASYKGKNEWVKVSFWCKVLRLDKEELKNGEIRVNESNGKL